MKTFLKWVSYTLLGAIVIVLGSMLMVTTFSSASLAIVRSASMEPTMPAGSVAIMIPVDPETVQVGDIIVFTPPWDPDVTVSHRVIDMRHENGLHFDTKGDAMEDADPYYVPASDVQGKVLFNIPHVGFATNEVLPYIKTWWGLVIFIMVPSMIIFGNTIRDVNRSTNRHYQQRQKWLKRHQRKR